MKSRKIWKTVLIALGCALGAWAFGALLLPVLLPFFIGLAVSLLAEKPVRLLQTRAHVPRSLASGLCVLLLFGLLFGVLFSCAACCARRRRIWPGSCPSWRKIWLRSLKS